MDIITLFLLALALSADAFAAAFGLGLCSSDRQLPARSIQCGAVFGSFQAVMPLLGFLLFSLIGSAIDRYDHWVAFLLLSYIGISMIIDSIKEKKKSKGSGAACETRDKWSLRNLLMLGLATSIDAFAAGISLAALGANMYVAIPMIGAVTFLVSAGGMFFGKKLGSALRSYSGIVGGAVLIIIGVRALLQGLFLKG